MIEVKRLTRRFGAFKAVDDVSFHLERGEVVGFLGPNGAGKTTTMRMLTGFLPPTSGAITIDGLDVFRDSLEARRRIGYLPESVPLYREHRVEEMLLFQGRLHGLSRRAARERIGPVLERVGLGDRRRHLIGNLSKGQRQRVGLAVALLPDPEVLILDEPTSGLDPLQRVEVRGLVRELAADRTVLLSSHILPEIEAVCPRVLILHKGRVAADGTRTELSTLLGSAHVRVEAVVPDAGEARRLLGSLPGVREVTDQGRLGIHHAFDVEADEDVREDVGALAAQKGWALRELSWREATLEGLFARIAAGVEEEAGLVADAPKAAPAAPVAAAPAPRAPEPPSGGLHLNPFAPVPSAGRSAVKPLSPFERAAGAASPPGGEACDPDGPGGGPQEGSR